MKRKASVSLLAATFVTSSTRAFAPHSNNIQHHARSQHHARYRLLVARVPDAIMEQFSTRSLLDEILDESLRQSARRPLMMEFDPSSKAMWLHWRGTIFAETWRSTVKHMVWSLFVYLVLLTSPPAANFIGGFHVLWIQLLSVTTFTLSFFVNQTYSTWRTCLTISRTLQGRLSDIMMTLSTHAKREQRNGKNQYVQGSRKVLLICARYVRLFHILCYASFTRSHRPLLTPRGMRRLQERGVVTDAELRILTESPKVSATQRFNVVLMWIARTAIEARRAKLLDGGTGSEQAIVTKIQEIRGEANAIEGQLRGRMPFAYAHIVQILVDFALWLYPVAAFTQGASIQLSAIGAGLLTCFYQGLFDLAKRFLDPYHNENFWSGDDALLVDTLMAEVNAGSMRWSLGLDEVPILSRSFDNDDELGQHILPDEGYTIEYADLQLRKQDVMIKVKKTKAPLTREEVETKAAEVLEAAQEEYVETQRILNAPAGSDFIPGIDDDGESMVYYNPLSDEEIIEKFKEEGGL
jgi:hypothetical protein